MLRSVGRTTLGLKIDRLHNTKNKERLKAPTSEAFQNLPAPQSYSVSLVLSGVKGDRLGGGSTGND